MRKSYKENTKDKVIDREVGKAETREKQKHGGATMELVMDKTMTDYSVMDKEALEHNAQIKERYRQLQNAEAGQFKEHDQAEARAVETVRAAVFQAAAPAYAPVFNNTPTMEQRPQVTEYVRPISNEALFTTEKYDRIQDSVKETAYSAAPTLVADVMQTPVQEKATVKQLGYSLSPLAKLVMAVFTMVIVAMLALICVNTQAINQKTLRIKNLEQQREELMEEHEDVQRRIADAKSEETIREYAQSQGMVQGAQ